MKMAPEIEELRKLFMVYNPHFKMMFVIVPIGFLPI